MNQTESVGFWVGLISGISGIVLSIVAIIFSILVDRRSSAISDKTIQSLQKIESAVERSSSDTRELIKAGWDKMLDQVDREVAAPPHEASSAKQVAAGIAAELRSELAAFAPQKGESGKQDSSAAHFERYLKDLEASLSAQFQTAKSDSKTGTKFELVLDQVRGLKERAYAMLRAIKQRHLTQEQYKRLSEGPLGDSILELRRQGLLVPVVHKTDRGSVPCYYMPSEISGTAREVLVLLPKPDAAIEREVRSELIRIGYKHSEDS